MNSILYLLVHMILYLSYELYREASVLPHIIITLVELWALVFLISIVTSGSFSDWSEIILHRDTFYYDICALFSITKLQIYNKEKWRRMNFIIIAYKSVMDSNTFLFDPAGPKIVHSWVLQDQVASMYIQAVAQ